VNFAARLAAVSRQQYRRFVHGDADFYAWFQAVTPIDVIARMQIGSRPAVRPGKEGFDALRAVPWVFAWTQSRHMLPAWYGAGSGCDRDRRARARRRALGATRVDFFTALIDDLEASLARADLDIAAAYEELADRDQSFGASCARNSSACASRCSASSRPRALLDRDQTLQRSIELRNPYVDPINLLQVDLLRRWRETGRQDRDLFESLLACIAGIAEGLQSTG
jgi:phosphoenolpyruvate carboxylase